MIRYRQELDHIEPYIPGKHIDEVKHEYQLTDIIKLASNENPLGMGKKAQAAIMDALNQIYIYPDGNCTLLKQRLAQHLSVDPQNLIIGNGSDELFKLLAETYLTNDSEVIIAEPTFSQYRFAAHLMGAHVRSVPLRDYRHDLHAMAQCINDKTQMIFICNPNNPTGTIVTADELCQFIVQVPQHVLIVIDEAYYEYVRSPEYPRTLSLLNSYPNLIITRTFSKIHGLAALRVGYAIANPEVISALHKVKEPFNVNLLAQVAAIAALEDKEHVEQSVAVNETGKVYLYEQLAAMGLTYLETNTNFILINVQQDADHLFRRMLTKGVIIRSAAQFHLPTWIRVTIGTMAENERFITALKEVL